MPDKPIDAGFYQDMLFPNLQGDRPVPAEINVTPAKQMSSAMVFVIAVPYHCCCQTRAPNVRFDPLEFASNLDGLCPAVELLYATLCTVFTAHIRSRPGLNMRAILLGILAFVTVGILAPASSS